LAYIDLDEESQIAEVEKELPALLALYGIEAVTVANVNHAFNSSFKIVSTMGEEFALRINLGSGKSHNEVLAEVQWLDELHHDGSVLAPIPVRTASGDLFAHTTFAPLDCDVTAILCKWIPGEELDSEPSDKQLFELGQNIAKLHIFVPELTFTDGANLQPINCALSNTRDNVSTNRHGKFSDHLQEDVIQGLKLVDDVYARLSKNQELLPIHADLHAGNVLQTSGGLAIIDFDDAGLGLLVQDLVNSTYYIREDTEREKHLLAGYASLLELPKISDEDFEVLLMGRLLLLINTIVEMTSAEEIKFLPVFLGRAQRRLDHFFNTGKFSLLD
jgi:Ser/Thr protein kinase RdoA (MazF antagonist)